MKHSVTPEVSYLKIWYKYNKMKALNRLCELVPIGICALAHYSANCKQIFSLDLTKLPQAQKTMFIEKNNRVLTYNGTLISN